MKRPPPPLGFILRSSKGGFRRPVCSADELLTCAGPGYGTSGIRQPGAAPCPGAEPWPSSVSATLIGGPPHCLHLRRATMSPSRRSGPCCRARRRSGRNVVPLQHCTSSQVSSIAQSGDCRAGLGSQVMQSAIADAENISRTWGIAERVVCGRADHRDALSCGGVRSRALRCRGNSCGRCRERTSWSPSPCAAGTSRSFWSRGVAERETPKGIAGVGTHETDGALETDGCLVATNDGSMILASRPPAARRTGCAMLCSGHAASTGRARRQADQVRQRRSPHRRVATGQPAEFACAHQPERNLGTGRAETGPPRRRDLPGRPVAARDRTPGRRVSSR